MTRHIIALSTLGATLLLLPACPETKLVCDPGYVEMDDMCIRLDAGPADGGGGDGGMEDGGETDAPGMDAGPCGMPCTGTTPLCRETDGACVACLGDDNCTDPTAAKCDVTAGTCGACDDSAQCADIAGTPVCATAGARAGQCVACTADERTSCASGICLLTDNACAPMGGAANACTACVADAECEAGMLCVEWMYDDPTTTATDPVAAGRQCAWRQDASGAGAPNGDCFNIRPYARTGMATSVDGTAATVCTFRQSTCEAHADFSSLNCMTLDAAGDARCGMDSLDDGVCRNVSASTNRCTVFCGSDDDCRMGFTCNTGATPGVCRFM